MNVNRTKEPEVPVIRNYKDTVFRKVFGSKPELLELYNAVNETHYQNPNDLEIVTLDNAIYMTMKNDLAFLIDFQLHLYEHQSTVNPNMPLRFLHYIAKEYERLIDADLLYKNRPVKIPAPQFVVFYNGTSSQPERQTLTLSNMFFHKEDIPQLELKVLVLNINPGYNEALLAQSRTLWEYIQYVERVRRYTAEMDIEQAVARAIDECIQENILATFLRKNKAEVISMSIFEYNEEKVMAIIREEEREEGIAEGIQQGLLRGKIESILDFLGDLGEIPDSLRTQILAETQPDTLKKWLKLAAKSASIEQFINKM